MEVPNWVSVDIPWERKPAQYVPPGDPMWYPGLPFPIDPAPGWYQGGRRLHKVKPHYAFIWPKDGKRGATMGRWKDILQDKGPDIHVSISADKGDHMYNRQRRPRWSRWGDIIARGPDDALSGPLWARRHRGHGIRYDFRTRKYGKPNGESWMDARWPMEPNEGMRPYAYRDLITQWFQNEPEPAVDFDDFDDDFLFFDD